jgi:hypothetical protein
VYEAAKTFLVFVSAHFIVLLVIIFGLGFAERLQGVSDGRSGLGLLFLIAGREGHPGRPSLKSGRLLSQNL